MTNAQIRMPERAVERDRQMQKELHHRDAEDEAGKDQRDGGQSLDDPASGRPPHRQPGRQEGERHRQRCGGHRDQQGVGDQPDMIGREYGAIVVQRDAGERGHADRLIERQQRDPDQHRDRHEEKQQEIEHQDPGCRIAQPPEIERPRPKALAGDGRESLRVPRQPAVDVEKHQHQREHQHRERAGAADIGRRLVPPCCRRCRWSAPRCGRAARPAPAPRTPRWRG